MEMENGISIFHFPVSIFKFKTVFDFFFLFVVFLEK